MNPLRNDTLNWLLAGPAWIQYRTLLDLLDAGDQDEDVKRARTAMLVDPCIQDLIENCKGWEQYVLKRHNDAFHPIHILSFLSEIGLNQKVNGMEQIVKIISSHVSNEGLYQVVSNIPVHFGGSGNDQWSWMLCDAPLLLYCVTKFNSNPKPDLQRAVQYLLQLGRENGWPCAVSSDLGKFHGPGSRNDPCPYANLLMLKLVGLFPNLHGLDVVQQGIESALCLWEHSHDQWPYLFHMGIDFRKLKLPFIWYDILHMATVLSMYPQARKDPRFREMVEIIFAKEDKNGCYTPESIWIKWKGWEFAQKKEPSRWLTLVILVLQKRLMEGEKPTSAVTP